MLRFKNLGSGSSGNATVIQARGGTSITHLLVDCGLGIRQLSSRLAQAGLDDSDIDAIFITHEHLALWRIKIKRYVVVAD